MCDGCKYYFLDMSCNATDCGRVDDLTEEQFEEHFVNDKADCPFFEPLYTDDGYDELYAEGLING